MRVAVVHFGDATAPGGINKNVKETVSGLVDSGIEARIFQPIPAYDQIVADSLGKSICLLPRPILSPPFNLSRRFVVELRRELSSYEPDIVHVHSHMNLLSHSLIRMIKSKFPHQKIVFSPHFDVALSTTWLKRLFPLFNRTIGKRTSSRVDSFVFNSAFEQERYQASVSDALTSTTRISPGIDWEPLPRKRIWDSELKLMFCGHVIHRKRVDRLVRLVSALKSSDHLDGVKISATVSGGGPALESCKILAQELGIGGEMEWQPFISRDRLKKTISEADFFVLLSDSEAYGITIAEALSMGTPVLVSNTSALSEFADTPGAYAFDDPDDLTAIASFVASTRNEPIDVGPVSENICEWKEVIIKHINLYRKILIQ